VAATLDLTICICVRNGERHVDRCFSSLVRETEGSGVVIHVVDHLSTDRTPELLKTWENGPGRDGRIKLFKCAAVGIAAARDFAWRTATTEWIGFVDIDADVREGWLKDIAASAEALRDDAKCAAFGGRNHVPESSGPAIYRAYSIALGSYVGGHGSVLNRPVTSRVAVDHIPTLNVVYRRKALEDVGGFDPVFERVAEDIDLSFRLRRAGYTLLAVPGMALEHHMRYNPVAWARNMYLYGRGRMMWMLRHHGAFKAKFVVAPVIAFIYAIALIHDLFTGAPARALVTLLFLHFVAALAGIFPSALRGGRERPVRLLDFIAAGLVVVVTHISYGAGALRQWAWNRFLI